MRRILYSFVALLMLASALHAAPAPSKGGDGWIEDYKAALAQAKASHKRILLDFTGSDWCGWCKKLDAEVFATPEFKKYAASKLVLVKVDFPHSIAQSDAVKKQNQELQSKFGIEGYPTIIVLSSEGKQIGKAGYQPGGPSAFIKTLEGIK